MLTPSESNEKFLNANEINATVQQTEYYLSEVFRKLGYNTFEDLEASLTDTFNTLYSSNVSIKQNFKQVFRMSDGKMYTDWKISPLAFDLLKLQPVAS